MKSTEKMSEKMSEKILAVIAANLHASAAVIAGELGLSSRTVERTLARLKAEGLIKRIGPAKGGHWEIK